MQSERSWILLVFLLGSLSTACSRSQTKPAIAVQLDLTRLLGQQDRNKGSVSLSPVGHVKDLPHSVVVRLGKEIADPGGAFNATDVGAFNVPRRRLLFAGLSDKYCLVHYEYGGRAHGYRVALFEITGSTAVLVWTHAGGNYASLQEFANEADPQELENEVNNAIL